VLLWQHVCSSCRAFCDERVLRCVTACCRKLALQQCDLRSGVWADEGMTLIGCSCPALCVVVAVLSGGLHVVSECVCVVQMQLRDASICHRVVLLRSGLEHILISTWVACEHQLCRYQASCWELCRLQQGGMMC
jgi:hypothetical protein